MPTYQRVGMGIALVPEGRRLFAAMTVEENLQIARASGRKGQWTVDRVMETFPMLKARRNARCSTLSGGEQQATAIGRALMTNPRLLLLDEVSLGLSPLAVNLVYKSVESLIASGATILLVEQDLNRALKVANRVMCMLEGRIVVEGNAGSLTREQITDAYFGHQKRARAE
jgi:branched-chain amino acid transport system ATP-binding protein